MSSLQAAANVETTKKKVLATTENTPGPNPGLAGSMKATTHRQTSLNCGHQMATLIAFAQAFPLATLKMELKHTLAQMAQRLVLANQTHPLASALK